jgi:hypothetical protein
MWFAVLPVATRPLWQVEQAPFTASWSNRTLDQLEVTWQSSQVLVVGIWLPGLPVACVPLWQVEQEPLTEA